MRVEQQGCEQQQQQAVNKGGHVSRSAQLALRRCFRRANPTHAGKSGLRAAAKKERKVLGWPHANAWPFAILMWRRQSACIFKLGYAARCFMQAEMQPEVPTMLESRGVRRVHATDWTGRLQPAPARLIPSAELAMLSAEWAASSICRKSEVVYAR